MVAIKAHRRASAERIIPAIARPFFADFKPRKPNIKPTIPKSPEQGKTKALGQILKIPKTRDAIPKPDLSFTVVGAFGGKDSVVILSSSDMRWIIVVFGTTHKGNG